MRTKTAQFAFLWVVLILCWGASMGAAQTPVTRPAISEEVSPVQEFSVEMPDGSAAVGVLRRPPGPGPFPAVVITYPYPVSRWRTMALDNATMTRFLAAGYVTVMEGSADPLPGLLNRTEDFLPGLVASTLATVNHVKNMSYVDSNSVVLYGCSLGGFVVLEASAETEVAAITAEEPGGYGYGTVMALPSQPTGVAEWIRLNEDPHKFFTPEFRRSAQEEFRKISGPIFLAQGDGWLRAGAVDMHNEFLIPDLKAAGNEVEMTTYPGQNHCFGFFATSDRGVANDGDAAASRFFADMDAFFKRHLPTQPRAVDDSLIEHVAIEPVSVSSETVPERVAITVSSEILADYVGTYELLLLGFDLVLTLEDDQLMGEAPAFGKFQFSAESETNFFSNEGPELEFVRGDDGIVTHVMVRFGIFEATAPRKSTDG